MQKDGYVSARTSKKTDLFFKGNRLQGSGAISSLVLESFPVLYESTTEKIKQIFTREELLTILTSNNGRRISPEDPQLVDILRPIKDHKYKDFDVTRFIEKANTLSLPEVFLVEIWANTFWYGEATDDPEEYIK